MVRHEWAAQRLAVSCAAGNRRERTGCGQEADGGKVRAADQPGAFRLALERSL
jgi:hypothetical protein